MSSLSKIGNNIIVATNRGTPVAISNWNTATCAALKEDVAGTMAYRVGGPVKLSFAPVAEFLFTDDVADRDGLLTLVNGQNVAAFTNEEIVTLINNVVLTDDKFSGTVTPITDTTQHVGRFTAFQVDEEAILDVTAVIGTIMVDGNGDPVDISAWAGQVFPALIPKYGTFTALKLVSGAITGYSNL